LTAVRLVSALTGPSTDFFTQYVNDSMLTYIGITNDVRAIPTKWWNGQYTGNFTNPRTGDIYDVQQNISYYFVETNQVSGWLQPLPLRVHMQMHTYDFNTGNSTNANHYYDWIDFTPEKPPAAMFIPPATCTSTDVRQRIQLPSISTVSPPPSGQPAAPSIPGQFHMVIEAKQMENSSESVFSGTWYFDRLANRERFDYLNDDWVEEVQLVIYDEDQPSGGFQYIIKNDLCKTALLSVNTGDEAFDGSHLSLISPLYYRYLISSFTIVYAYMCAYICS
jgi:hypothetical protein